MLCFFHCLRRGYSIVVRKWFFTTTALLRQIKQEYLKREVKKKNRQVTKTESTLAVLYLYLTNSSAFMANIILLLLIKSAKHILSIFQSTKKLSNTE